MIVITLIVVANSNIAYAEVVNESVSMVYSVDSDAVTVNKNAIVTDKASSVIVLLLDPNIR